MPTLPLPTPNIQPKVDAAVRFAHADGRMIIGPLDRLDERTAPAIRTEIRPRLDQGIIYV